MTFEHILRQPDGILVRRKSKYFDIGVRKIGSEVQLIFYQNQGKASEIQAEIDLHRPDFLLARYKQAMVSALVWQPHPQKIFLAGLGGGCLPMVLRHMLPDATMIVTEIDKEVALLAKEYFGFVEDTRLSLVLDDGRNFLHSNPGNIFNIIFLDAFLGDGRELPHMITKEFFQLCKARLTPSGVLCLNALPNFPNYYSQLRTLTEVFDHVAMIPVEGNTILVGFSQGETDEQIIKKEGWNLERRHHLQFPMASHLTQVQFADKLWRAPVLHDS